MRQKGWNKRGISIYMTWFHVFFIFVIIEETCHIYTVLTYLLGKAKNKVERGNTKGGKRMEKMTYSGYCRTNRRIFIGVVGPRAGKLHLLQIHGHGYTEYTDSNDRLEQRTSSIKWWSGTITTAELSLYRVKLLKLFLRILSFVSD